MMKKQKGQTKRQHALEGLANEQKKLAAIEKEMAVLARQREREDQAIKKGPNFFLIILLMAGIWGLSHATSKTKNGTTQRPKLR